MLEKALGGPFGWCGGVCLCISYDTMSRKEFPCFCLLFFPSIDWGCVFGVCVCLCEWCDIVRWIFCGGWIEGGNLGREESGRNQGGRKGGFVFRCCRLRLSLMNGIRNYWVELSWVGLSRYRCLELRCLYSNCPSGSSLDLRIFESFVMKYRSYPIDSTPAKVFGNPTGLYHSNGGLTEHYW